MISMDTVNGLFEFAGGLLCWVNVKTIYRDKRISGISWGVQAFFALWGIWNLFYYPSLGQWASFWGGLFLSVGNTTWVMMSIVYCRRNGEL